MQRTAKAIGVALMVCLGIVVAPAAASASSAFYYYPGGAAVPAGTQVTGTISGPKFTTGIGTTECNNGTVTGTVKAGSPATMQIEKYQFNPRTIETENNCIFPYGNLTAEGKLKIETPQCLGYEGFEGGQGLWALGGGACGSPQAMRMTWEIPGGNCHYVRASIITLAGPVAPINASGNQKWVREGKELNCPQEPKVTLGLIFNTLEVH